MLGLAAFLTGLFVAASAEPAAGPTAGRRTAARSRHLGRPAFGGPVRRISAAVHRRAGAAGQRDGVPQRLSGPCGDRDLPRTLHDPHRIASDAHGDHRQHLGRPVRPAVRQDGLLRRRRARRGLFDHQLHRVALPSAGADAGRPPEAALAAEPQRRRGGQGSGGGDDGRASLSISAGIWDGKKFASDNKSAAVPATIAKANAALAAVACGCAGAA